VFAEFDLAADQLAVFDTRSESVSVIAARNDWRKKSQS
jgi:hypothetical protein